MVTKKMPHDKLFRCMMRNPDCQRAFIRRHLPQRVQNVIDMDQLAQISEHFAQAHQSLIPDCVLQAPFQQEPGRFYLVIEQETSPRASVIKRLLLTKLRIIEFDFTMAQESDIYPAVWCVLLCTGARRYKGALDVLCGVCQEVRTVIEESWIKAPQLLHVLDTPDVTYSEFPELDAMQLLMKHIRDPDLVQVLTNVKPLLEQIANKPTGEVYVNALLNYAIAHGSTDTRRDIMSLEGLFEGKLEEVFMTLARALEDKGIEKGKKMGREEGHEEGHEEGLREGKLIGFEEGRAKLIREMLSRGVNPKYISKTTGLSLDEIQALRRSK